jgi:hypothetical protein
MRLVWGSVAGVLRRGGVAGGGWWRYPARAGGGGDDEASVLESLRGIGFRSLQEAIGTTTPGGRLMFHIFGSLAELTGSQTLGSRLMATSG